MPRQRPEWYREDGYVTTDDPTIKAVNEVFIRRLREMRMRGKVDPNNVAIMRFDANDLDELFFSVLEAIGKL